MFDEYDIPKSLKPATIHVWLGDIDPVAYHITERERGYQKIKAVLIQTIKEHNFNGLACIMTLLLI